MVDRQKNMVLGTTTNTSFQMYNEGVIADGWHKPNTWYKINGSYGNWVLENEFPNTKGGEMINVVEIN